MNNPENMVREVDVREFEKSCEELMGIITNFATDNKIPVQEMVHILDAVKENLAMKDLVATSIKRSQDHCDQMMLKRMPMPRGEQ